MMCGQLEAPHPGLVAAGGHGVDEMETVHRQFWIRFHVVVSVPDEHRNSVAGSQNAMAQGGLDTWVW